RDPLAVELLQGARRQRRHRARRHLRRDVQGAEDRHASGDPRAPAGRLRVHGHRRRAVDAGGRHDRAWLRRALHADQRRGPAARLSLHAQSRADVLRRSLMNLRRAASLLAAAATITLTTEASAGDPDLDWWTIETKHFKIHYDRP